MVVAHREAVVELPLTVEEALRLLVSGGVIVPDEGVGRRSPARACRSGRTGRRPLPDVVDRDAGSGPS